MTVVTQTVVRALLAPLFVTALAILVKGYADTGDGFSAGVIAAFAVLLQVVAFGREEVEKHLPLHLAPRLVATGLLLALAVVFLPLLAGEPPATHHPRPGASVIHLGSLELHTAVLFDAGVFLLVIGFTIGVIDRIGRRRERDEEEA
jgi:multisubunit Na+/H+ antiporter MnhB subunit